MSSPTKVIPARTGQRVVPQVVVPRVIGASLATAAVLAPITPSADAYVQSDVPSMNFGTAATLNNIAGTPEARAYVKFDVSGVSGTITKATFRAFTQTSSGRATSYTVADNTWTEAGLELQQPAGRRRNHRLRGELHGQHLDERGRDVDREDDRHLQLRDERDVLEPEEVRQQGVGRERPAAPARDCGAG